MLDPVVLLHRREAADRLRVSVCTIKRWGAAGLLDERKVGPKLVKITEASVSALMAQRKDAAA
jgi:predicted site-specific integrase-resolvase